MQGLMEVPVDLLKIGMYVAAVDRPWLETPFAVQGFFVESKEDIDYVAAHCEHVFVDPRRVVRKKCVNEHVTSTGPRNTTSFKNELRRARIDYESAAVAIDKVFSEIKRNRHLDVETTETVVAQLIESMLRNNEALAALLRMKHKSDYVQSHCISTAVWAILFGRHMGFDKNELKVLALGAALIDIGMINLPRYLLEKPEALTANEHQLVQGHVKSGLKLLKESGVIDHRIIEIVACHHERHNGSGYPKQLKGADIPLAARIVSVADAYDAMITPRPYRQARSSFEAIQELTDLKGSLFHPDVTEAFIQAIGIFPTGAIVELNSGEVGIVVAQNPHRRLKPEIIVVLDEHKERYQHYITCNLEREDESSRRELWIVKELEPGSYGLDAQDFFL